MPLVVTCQCSNSYELKDEFAGKLVKCPQCGAVSRAEATTFTPRSQADPAFDRDVFLLRQKHMSLNEKYVVADETAAPIIYVERPSYVFSTFLAVLGALAAVFAVSFVLALLGAMVGEASGAAVVLQVLFPPVAAVTFVIALMGLRRKRHVTFYRDEKKGERLLDVLQDRRIQFPTVTFTVRDAGGTPIAGLAKNYLRSILRKQWEIRSPDGAVLCRVREDSIILSLLRRVLGPFFGLLRTNFVFERPAGETPLGEFKRKMTLLDRYVLDLAPDRARWLDRRVALALGVMLDTGERR